MSERLPRLQRFSEGLKWLRNEDPARYEAVRQAVRTHLRMLTLFGAHEGDVPPRYGVRAVLRYSITQSLMLLLVFPAALLGGLIWLPPFATTRWIAPRFRPELDQVATYKIGTAILAFPLWYGVLSAAAVLGWGLWAGVAVMMASPILGLAAVAWRERQARVREDVRVFFRTLTSPRGKDRLHASRTRLVAEFDALEEAMRATRGPDPSAPEGPDPS